MNTRTADAPVCADGRFEETRLRVLIVEDEALFAKAVAKKLAKAGHDSRIAGTLREARAALAEFTPDVTLLDLRLPDGAGIELLAQRGVGAREENQNHAGVGAREEKQIHARRDSRAGAPVIVITAFGEVADAVEAMKLGAADYLKKPIDLDELMIAVEKVRATARLQNRLDYSRERDSHLLEQVELIGVSPAMQRVREQIDRLAQLGGDRKPAPTVLILGETGTGKDLVARALHLRGPGRARPFVQVDCASLPRELMEAELFGHEKGAFTGAHAARAGLIEAAEDGAVFLDEIGELPLDLQAKLLNVIERRRLRRIGSTRERVVEARFIAGTNRDLAQAIERGMFRADLYYRLNVVSITLPRLNERGDDVLLLARHYAAATARRYRLPEPVFEPMALHAIGSYRWPGNIRELKNLVERAVLLSDGRTIGMDDLGLARPKANAEIPFAALDTLTLDGAEKLLIERVLRQTHGNVSEAARRLGVSRMAMRYRMDKHGLKPAAEMD